MPMAPASPAQAASGIALDQATQDRVVPVSRRADGSIRKEIKIRPGFTPQEDVQRFRSPRALERASREGSPGVFSGRGGSLESLVKGLDHHEQRQREQPDSSPLASRRLVDTRLLAREIVAPSPSKLLPTAVDFPSLNGLEAALPKLTPGPAPTRSTKVASPAETMSPISASPTAVPAAAPAVAPPPAADTDAADIAAPSPAPPSPTPPSAPTAEPSPSPPPAPPSPAAADTPLSTSTTTTNITGWSQRRVADLYRSPEDRDAAPSPEPIQEIEPPPVSAYAKTRTGTGASEWNAAKIGFQGRDRPLTPLRGGGGGKGSQGGSALGVAVEEKAAFSSSPKPRVVSQPSKNGGGGKQQRQRPASPGVTSPPPEAAKEKKEGVVTASAQPDAPAPLADKSSGSVSPRPPVARQASGSRPSSQRGHKRGESTSNSPKVKLPKGRPSRESSQVVSTPPQLEEPRTIFDGEDAPIVVKLPAPRRSQHAPPPAVFPSPVPVAAAISRPERPPSPEPVPIKFESLPLDGLRPGGSRGSSASMHAPANVKAIAPLPRAVQATPVLAGYSIPEPIIELTPASVKATAFPTEIKAVASSPAPAATPPSKPPTEPKAMRDGPAAKPVASLAPSTPNPAPPPQPAHVAAASSPPAPVASASSAIRATSSSPAGSSSISSPAPSATAASFTSTPLSPPPIVPSTISPAKAIPLPSTDLLSMDWSINAPPSPNKTNSQGPPVRQARRSEGGNWGAAAAAAAGSPLPKKTASAASRGQKGSSSATSRLSAARQDSDSQPKQQVNRNEGLLKAEVDSEESGRPPMDRKTSDPWGVEPSGKSWADYDDDDE